MNSTPKHLRPGTVYEIDGGYLRACCSQDSDMERGRPSRSGRKSRTTLYTLEQTHRRAIAEIKHREQIEGRVAPPPELTERRALPLIASYFLYRNGLDLGQYLSPSTHVLHRRLLREYVGIDIGRPFDE